MLVWHITVIYSGLHWHLSAIFLNSLSYFWCLEIWSNYNKKTQINELLKTSYNDFEPSRPRAEDESGTHPSQAVLQLGNLHMEYHKNVCPVETSDHSFEYAWLFPTHISIIDTAPQKKMNLPSDDVETILDMASNFPLLDNKIQVYVRDNILGMAVVVGGAFPLQWHPQLTDHIPWRFHGTTTPLTAAH